MERNCGRNGGRLESNSRRGTRDCGIFAQDYGQAGSIDFFGKPGLPGAMSGDRSYLVSGVRAAIRAIA